MKNERVVEMWKAGNPASNSSKKSLWTDGEFLNSYRMKIGRRTKSGVTVLADYRASTGHFQSQTTSTHIGLAARVGVDMIMHPMVWETSPLSKS